MSKGNRDFATLPTTARFHRQLAMIPTAEGTAFAYWIWSNSNAHMSGLWEMNESKAARELGLSLDEVDSLIRELVGSKIIQHDVERGVVFNPEQARFRAHLLSGADPTKKQNGMIKPTIHHIGSMLDSHLAKVCLATLVNENQQIPLEIFLEHFGWSVSDLDGFGQSIIPSFDETRKEEERREEAPVRPPVRRPVQNERVGGAK